jgi:curli biogenesis system outer membrane secretion channel CsgG
VAAFDPQNVSAGDAAVIADMFRAELVKQGRFDIIEKVNMDKILAEQAFQQSGCTTAECAVKLGKILNVRYLIVGSFGKLMDQYVLNIRMVETESAKVIYSDAVGELSTQRAVQKAIAAMTTRLGKAYGSK